MVRQAMILTAMLIASIATAAAEDLPKALAGEIVATEHAYCETSTGYDVGFVLRRDVDGDGRPDVVLDYSRALCGGAHEPYCEGERCLLQVWQAAGSGWRKLFDGKVANWRFDGNGGRSVLIVDGRPLSR
ncbi:hypothetical protein EYW49_14180 [Siculibacillus lacustris]|uniref:DUF2147 domain-containing protein n=1 Tax=Siculibacillus lacustris TaxID=1549641 RepID=A0A4Q9VLH5_9HYPH|nr:hypothetical protein [Siculibacillus lacustris]TBW36251.1 hypothetical protein EYW49_14180 [Siculibacillus lacustris]